MSHEKDLNLTRRVEAPREKVWEAFTRPEHLMRWWAPGGFTMPTCELDLRPGGAWNYSFRSPEGWEHSCRAVFQEVVPPEKLVNISMVPGPDGKPLFRIRQTLTLAEEGKGTQLALKVEVLEAHPGSEPYLAGMEQGTNMTLDNLGPYLQG